MTGSTILKAHLATAFLSPAGILGLQPSPKHLPGEPVKESVPTGSQSFAAVTSEVCPACQSSLSVTAAKKPDADSYWRCTRCGEVWNVSRSRTRELGRNRWR